MPHHSIHISAERVKEIAEYLDAGMLCFYHISTSTIDYYPDPLKNNMQEEELWKDVMDKIDVHCDEYIRFEGMDSRESFMLMQSFIEAKCPIHLQERFSKAITHKKPFQHFKSLLLDYPDLREDWFVYKNQQYIAFVQNQINRYDS